MSKLANNLSQNNLITPFLLKKNSKSLLLSLFLNKVQAGFPSPAEDYIKDRLSLDDILILNPAATYLVQAKGDSMIGAGIHDNSYLIIDRSLEVKNNDIVIVSINYEFTVKRYMKKTNGGIYLLSENPKYKPIKIKQNFENIFWGVVTSIVTILRK